MSNGQLSFADVLMDPRLGANARLEAIDAAIDWRRLGALAAKIQSPREIGRPCYAAFLLLKAIYLQALCDLSDPGLEEALIDRLSFRRFCGCGIDQPAPDETTICRFRNALAAANVLSECFAEVNAQLERKGLILRKGTIVDATIVASASPPRGPQACRRPSGASIPSCVWRRHKRRERRSQGSSARTTVDDDGGWLLALARCKTRKSSARLSKHPAFSHRCACW
jgi:transposase, IS5 family